MAYKITAVLLLFLGESLAIYSEVAAAKQMTAGNFVKMSLLMTIGGVMLVTGYVLGMKHLANIWVIGAISIASIVIMEPVLTYSIFHELPSRGALIGLVLGMLGLSSALLIK